MSAARKAHLVALARKYDFVVLADEVRIGHCPENNSVVAVGLTSWQRV
jgi:hypothetical protein